MFSSEQWLANSGANFYNGVATTSLRFDDGSSAYLTRTPDSASNRKTWTWSGWYKLGNLGLLSDLFNAGPSGTDRVEIHTYLNQLTLYMNTSGTASEVVASPLLRDPSAWYHFVVACDTTQATSSNRVKLYINGNLQSLSTASYPPQDFTSGANNTTVNVLGRRNYGTDRYLDGYLSEVNFIDGLALTPTSFGETKNSAWIPVDTSSLTFGTNGFRLQFDQVGVGTASTSTIGADTSGNTNHFTSSGIVASDCSIIDSPENNFATLNPLVASTGTFSNGNLNVSTATVNATSTTMFQSTGKLYWEVVSTSGTAANTRFGFVNTSGAGVNLGSTANTWAYLGDARLYHNGSTSSYGVTYATNDIIMIALDLDAGKVWYGKNGTWMASGNPATGANPSQTFTANQLMCPAVASGTGTFVFSLNCGQDASFSGAITAGTETDANGYGLFKYAPPSGGYLSLCTANIPEPTIGPNSDTQADDYFNTVLYTGTGSSQAITGVGFQPDWVWTKGRSVAYSHYLFDSSRGVQKRLMANVNNAEDTLSNGLTAFGTDGFTHGGEAGMGENTKTFVAWNWKANGGTTSSNTDGSITSTVQANTDAGFSIVSWTGNGSDGATVGHGLNAVPDMIINKKRNATQSWYVWHQILASTNGLSLDTTAAQAAFSYGTWGTKNSTIMTVDEGGNGLTNVNENTHTYIAYCFHSVEGYSKFGLFEGNGNDDGTFVFTNFAVSFLMIKSIDSTSDWLMFDNKREGYNVDNDSLSANSSGVEATTDMVDLLSNGFKLRDATDPNVAETYIYMAFGDSFKYANAR